MNKIDRILADEILSRQITLMRFSAGEKKRVFDILLKMQTELKIKLQNGFTDVSKARMLKLLNQCTKMINDYYTGIQAELDLDGLAKNEVVATRKAFAQIDLDISMPSAAIMKALVSDALIDGAPLSAWWERQAESTAFNFASQVRQGVAQGENITQIVRRITGDAKHGITGIMDVAERNASTLVHDAVMQIANDSRLSVFQANDDIVKGLRQLSTLDSRTSNICIAYSGAEWDLNGKPIKKNLPFGAGCPRHPNCRSAIVPMTKSYKELGVNIPDKAPGSRASDLGQIPADTSFEDFLNRHDSAYLNNILGKGRADLYRRKKITLSQLVDGYGRELTLEQLKELYE